MLTGATNCTFEIHFGLPTFCTIVHSRRFERCQALFLRCYHYGCSVLQARMPAGRQVSASASASSFTVHRNCWQIPSGYLFANPIASRPAPTCQRSQPRCALRQSSATASPFHPNWYSRGRWPILLSRFDSAWVRRTDSRSPARCRRARRRFRWS